MVSGLLLATSACGGSANPATDSAVKPVAVSVSDCGSSWQPDAAGTQHLAVRNDDIRAGEVDVVGAGVTNRGQVFAQVEPLGPGTTVALHLRLAAGDYALRCLMEDANAVTGPTVTVTGDAAGDPGVRPVTTAQMIRPALGYTRWVLRQLPGLARDTVRLRADLAVDDRTRARTDWLVAHLAYERLGAAYDAFGPVDAVINGLPDGLFQRLEHGLWHGATAASLRPLADRLVTAEGHLRHQLETNQIDPLTISIRAHEISENALQFQLTGLDDFGSHTSLATLAAEMQGTLVVLRLVNHLLAPRLSYAAELPGEVRAVLALARTHHRSGVWQPVQSLGRIDRERLAAAVSALCERLAPVASILEPRRTS